MMRHLMVIALAVMMVACGNGLDREGAPVANTPVILNCPVWIVNTVSNTMECWYGAVVNASGVTVAQGR